MNVRPMLARVLEAGLTSLVTTGVQQATERATALAKLPQTVADLDRRLHDLEQAITPAPRKEQS